MTELANIRAVTFGQTELNYGPLLRMPVIQWLNGPLVLKVLRRLSTPSMLCHCQPLLYLIQVMSAEFNILGHSFEAVDHMGRHMASRYLLI